MTDHTGVRLLRTMARSHRVLAEHNSTNPKAASLNKGTLEMAAEFDALADRFESLYQALAFAASVIKSGESWSPTCEEIIGGALRNPAPAPLPAQPTEAAKPYPHAHRCPDCTEWCVCAEFYDESPCAHCGPLPAPEAT